MSSSCPRLSARAGDELAVADGQRQVADRLRLFERLGNRPDLDLSHARLPHATRVRTALPDVLSKIDAYRAGSRARHSPPVRNDTLAGDRAFRRHSASSRSRSAWCPILGPIDLAPHAPRSEKRTCSGLTPRTRSLSGSRSRAAEWQPRARRAGSPARRLPACRGTAEVHRRRANEICNEERGRPIIDVAWVATCSTTPLFITAIISAIAMASS